MKKKWLSFSKIITNDGVNIFLFQIGNKLYVDIFAVFVQYSG